MVSFTGSTGVGVKIYESGAQTMKRLLMELGGKGAAVIFDDADVDAAVTALVSVWGFHSGQICTAPTRAVVQRGVYDEVVEKLAQSRSQPGRGPPDRASTVVGPVISAAQRDRIEAYVRGGVDEGAELVAGGERPDFDKGFYVAPTLIAGCNNTMTAAREEIFGPVIVVVPFDDDDEGIAIANDSEYGLYDYVYSGDASRAYRVARPFDAATSGSTPRSATRDAVRRLQDERYRAGRRRFRPARLHRDAVHHLAGVSAATCHKEAGR